MIDERDGRRAALQRGLVVIGTIGVLERAADDGLLRLEEVLGHLAQTDFRVDPRIIAAALKRQEDRRRTDASGSDIQAG